MCISFLLFFYCWPCFGSHICRESSWWQNAYLLMTVPTFVTDVRVFEKCFPSDLRYSLWEICVKAGRIVSYVTWIWRKYHANVGTRFTAAGAGMIFQTRSCALNNRRPDFEYAWGIPAQARFRRRWRHINWIFWERNGVCQRGRQIQFMDNGNAGRRVIYLRARVYTKKLWLHIPFFAIGGVLTHNFSVYALFHHINLANKGGFVTQRGIAEQ